MSQKVEAVFESGVLRPLGRVDLSEHEVVVLSIEKAEHTASRESMDRMTVEQKQAIMALLDEMDLIAEKSPADGFSHRDHDRIIYGVQ
jgi:predicted DNA-binding antitoxin AbrB/MazE fold protein